jgi:hypothetical protein
MDENTTITTEQKDAAPAQSFTQAENDRLVGQAIVRERAKYADYDDKTKQLESLLSAQKEKDLADATDNEKLTMTNSDLVTEITNAKTELEKYKQKQVRNDVLNGTEFAQLPRAYKNMVELSDSQDSVMESAKAVLAEFEKDTGKKITATFGIPEQKDTILSEPAKKVENSTDLANSLRSKITSIIKNRNAG